MPNGEGKAGHAYESKAAVSFRRISIVGTNSASTNSAHSSIITNNSAVTRPRKNRIFRDLYLSFIATDSQQLPKKSESGRRIAWGAFAAASREQSVLILDSIQSVVDLLSCYDTCST